MECDILRVVLRIRSDFNMSPNAALLSDTLDLMWDVTRGSCHFIYQEGNGVALLLASFNLVDLHLMKWINCISFLFRPQIVAI